MSAAAAVAERAIVVSAAEDDRSALVASCVSRVGGEGANSSDGNRG